MRSKNSKSLTVAEEEWIALVKKQPCSLPPCAAAGPSDAHHIVQGQHFTAVALCKDCHQGPRNGWHGRRAMWHLAKFEEVDALAVTIENVYRELRHG